MHLFFQIQYLQLLIFYIDGQNVLANLGYVLLVFFCNIIKVKKILYCFIIFLHLISSFLHTKYLLVPYAHASIKSIICILLSSFEIKTILLISSVKTLCLLFLNLCCVFNITLLFFTNSLRQSTSMLFFSRGFILFSVSAVYNQFL